MIMIGIAGTSSSSGSAKAVDAISFVALAAEVICLRPRPDRRQLGR
jgi:hypothetical protein